MGKFKIELENMVWYFDNPDGTVRIAVVDETIGEFVCKGCGEVVPVEAIYTIFSFDEVVELATELEK